MTGVVLIFGVSGFVGGYLAEEFCSFGYKVYGCDISESSDIADQVTFIPCDILDQVHVRKVISETKPMYIVDLAAISSVSYSWKEPAKTMAVNVEGTLNIFESAKEIIPNAKILVIGSSEEYQQSDDPINEEFSLDSCSPYGLSKITQERFAKLYR